MPTLYDVLGASPDASFETLHRAYRARARRLHPDIAQPQGQAEEAMRELNEAWAVLRDPASRAEYDLTLSDEDLLPWVTGPRWGRRAPILVVLAVLMAIFIITAYVAVPTTGR
ncbi:MAG: molecular chaperone DnaJ [Acidimicrobiaceae bacterium]|nr:molecular chaperone DnaJ [Acidimicrobiaceae bacterium]